MNKSFFASFLAILTIVLSSCVSDPWVGTWIPDNDSSGSTFTQINSNGTIEICYDGDDGSASIEGKWIKIEDQENTIKVTFDTNTIDVDIDNPLVEYIIVQALKQLRDEIRILTVSDDGEFLHIPGSSKGFVKY